jgi:hypothetical protein
MSEYKYLITDRRCGLGDTILNLYATWFLAFKLKRHVIIDWRRLPYNITCFEKYTRHHINLFHSLFASARNLKGVKFYFVEEFSDLFLGPKTKDGFPFDLDHIPSIEDGDINPKFLRMHSRLGQIDEEHIRELAPALHTKGYNFLDFFLNPKEPSESAPNYKKLLPLHEFIDHFNLSKTVGEIIHKFKNDHLSNNEVTGIHFRHGNGENIVGRSSNWISVDKACEFIINKVSLKPSEYYFVCSDNYKAKKKLLEFLPNSFSCDNIDTELSSALHLNADLNPIKTIKDSFVDMMLLRSCKNLYLTYGSTFSVLACSNKTRSNVFELFPID